MRILPIEINRIKRSYLFPRHKTTLTFKGSDEIYQSAMLERGQFFEKSGVIHNYQYTSYARGDLDWENFAHYLKEKYSDSNELNIFVFACSTGEEAYTMALLLNKIYPGKKIKIKAIDIDKNAISECNNLKESAKILSQYVIFLKAELYLNEEQMRNSFYQTEEANYKFQPHISEMVDFERRNILDYPFEEYSSKPSLVLMRNMWFYVKDSEHKPFAQNLYRALAPNSIVVIGRVDRMRTSIHKELMSAGFEHPFDEMSEKNRLKIFEKKRK